MDTKALYQQSYAKIFAGSVPLEIPQSLIHFYRLEKGRVEKALKHLSPLGLVEWGGGTGLLSSVLQTDFSFAEISIVDFVSIALEKGKSSFPGFHFHCADVGEVLQLPFNASLSFDSHLFHCLVTLDSRINYLKNIATHLQSGGLFFLEAMIYTPQARLGEQVYLDEQGQLWDQKLGMPVRYAPSSLDLEGFLLQQTQLVVEKLTIPTGVHLHSPYGEFELMRVVLKKI